MSSGKEKIKKVVTARLTEGIAAGMILPRASRPDRSPSPTPTQAQARARGRRSTLALARALTLGLALVLGLIFGLALALDLGLGLDFGCERLFFPRRASIPIDRIDYPKG